MNEGSSTTYWRVAEKVQTELNALSSEGNDMYASMEANDSPGELADNLAAILDRVNLLANEIAANIKPLRAVAKALADVPGIEIK